jgi:Family of unknown function (DUF5654)
MVLVAGLAWNTAFSHLFAHVFDAGRAIAAQFAYATFITIFIIILIFILSRVLKQPTTFTTIGVVQDQ